MTEKTPNFEQRKAVDLAMSGHNVFLSGRAGTGKTFTVKYIVKMLEDVKTLVVSCTTGMACTLYEKSMTLHSFSGLKNSRLDLDALILSVTSNQECLKRWQSTDVLIIDEMSQCSMKIFETINVLAQKARGNTLVFGGMQVIGAGDFYQLPPVRNDIDEGQYCFESVFWREVFPHSVILQTVYRQDKTERQFLQVLGEMASGNCSQETVSLIKNQLSRKTLNEKDFDVDFIPHIFCNNFDANFYNMEELNKLPGDMRIYKAEDTCPDSVLRKVTVAEENLALKIGAEVMLLYNISGKLKNGTRGRIELSEDGPTVNFYHVGLVRKVTRYTWFAYKHGSSEIVGHRTQFPLKLAYGITAHKSQGQTLKAACVHSGKEFVPGQLYVACSRVSSLNGLSIVNFNEQKLIKSSSKVDNFYSSCCDDKPLPSLMCCTRKALCLDGINGELIDVQQYPDEFELDEEELKDIDNICSAYYADVDRNEQEDTVNLERVLNDILAQMSGHVPDLNEISSLALLDEIREEVVNISSQIAAKILDVIDILKDDRHLSSLQLFASIQQQRLFRLWQEKSTKKNTDASIKYDYRSLMLAEMSLCTDVGVAKEYAAVMNINEKELKDEHRWVMAKLIEAVRSDLIAQLYNVKFGNSAMNERQKKSVWEMSKEGQGKVRYVGGWTIIKLIYELKKYITANSVSCNLRVRREMHKRYMWISMLESLLLQSSNVHESSSYVETLTVTDIRQYRSNALVYVNDNTFEFFMDLEQKRINSLCHENINVLKGQMFSVAVDGVKCSSMLKQKWEDLFCRCDDNIRMKDRADVHLLYCKVVEKYFQMGAGQYLRDFRRDYKVTKTEAHRKKVLEKKLIKERQNDKVSLESIKQDTSENRQNSHTRLLCLVTKREDVFETTYSKKEIEVLYKAYGKKYCSSWNKAKLNEALVPCVKMASQFADPSAFDSS